MSLPKLNDIKYDIELPISKKKIQVRPWLVREEKALLVAKESENPDEVAGAIINILRACSFDEDVENMAMVDVEYLLLMVKSFSSGEMSEINIRCNNKVKDKQCGHIAAVEIDLQKETSLTDSKEVDPKIKLTDTIGVVMHPPRFSAFRALLKGKSLAEISFDTMAASIDYVWNDDEIIKDFSPEELSDFFENFNEDQLDKITKYLGSIPRLQVKHDYKCGGCGYKGQFVLENLFNFFIN